MPNLNQEAQDSFCWSALSKTGSKKIRRWRTQWPGDWVMLVWGPTLTSLSRKMRVGLEPGVGQALRLWTGSSPGLACHPQKHAEEMTTLASRQVLWMPKLKQHTSYYNDYNCWDSADVSNLTYLSLGYLCVHQKFTSVTFSACVRERERERGVVTLSWVWVLSLSVCTVNDAEREE